jgi:hypothetical protein
MFEPTPFLTDRLSRPAPGSSQLGCMGCLTWQGSSNSACGVDICLEPRDHLGRGGRVSLTAGETR